jgi:CubicO group peptidase (beta-lactamase class C family)
MDRADDEIGFCCLNAQPKDDLRLGRLYLNKGRRDGQQALPVGWVEASTTPEAPHLQPGENPESFWASGYGYKWWIPRDQQNGEYTAIGVWGQYIYVNSEHEVVIVKSSTGYHFDDNDHETIETVRAIAEAVAP